MVWLIPLTFGALGAFSMVMQTILLREFFVVAAGNEVSFGIAMAGWLLGVGGGSLAGAFFASRRQATAIPFSWAALALCTAAPLLLAAVRSLHAFGAMPQGMLMPLARSLYLVPLLSLPFCALSGFAFPLAARLRPLPAEKTAGAMAGAYAWESLGAVAGGILYTFLLAGRVAPVVITILFALPLLAASGAVSWAVVGGKRATAASLLMLFISLAALVGGAAGRFDSWLARQRWQGISAAQLVASRDTRFQNLQLGFMRGQYSLFANGQLASVFPDDEGNELLAAQLLTQHPGPRAVLVIGDVAGGLAKHLLRYPIASLTVVEIDAGVAKMIGDHLDASDRRALGDPRLHTHIMDGRRFVLLAARGEKGLRRRFDMAFIHQPDAWTAQINRYYTREFFLDLQRILTPGGVVALRLSSAENYASEIATPYTAAIYKTLASVFPAVAISPGMSNFLFASGSGENVSRDPAVLALRYAALAPAPARLAPVFASLYPEEKGTYIHDALNAAKVPSLNRDDRPIAYFLGSRLLGWSTGSPMSGMFAWFAKFTFITALAVLALLMLPTFLWALFRRRSGISAVPAVLAAAGGGFAGLSFEITAIFIFQNTWGFVYQAIGMLIALFMMGLGAGAAWTSGRIGKKGTSPTKATRLLAAVLVLISLASLAFLLLLPASGASAAGQLLLVLGLGGMGFLVGAILPLGMRVLDRLPAGRSAGILNSGDYLGGAAGSVLTAAFFLPLLGTRNSLILVSFVALAAALPLGLAAHAAGKGK